MDYQNIINILENTPDHPYKFIQKKWVEINGATRGTYNTNSQIKFKTTSAEYYCCRVYAIIMMHTYL